MYLTGKEVATRFKVSERMITGLARTGILPAIKVGRLWRFPIKGIEQWEKHQGVDQDEIDSLVKEILEDVEKGRR